MDTISRAIETIKHKQPDVELKLDEPLKNHTTFKVGGPVRVMIFPENATGLTEVYRILNEFGITPFILGNGSNILASDAGLDIIIISTLKLNNIELIETNDISLESQVEITVEAGALLSNVAFTAYENGLSGLEFAHGIPGTMGGAVVMNAGAYSGEIKDVIIKSTAYNVKTGVYTLTAPEHEFAYRHSVFSKSDDIVLSTVIELQKANKDSIKRKMNELSVRRRESQPLELPSSGSTFKRPKEGYAAALIEQAGLKGYINGGAQVSEKHAGFIVNRGDATFTEIMAVIEHVREVVFKRFGIELEPEIKIIS